LIPKPEEEQLGRFSTGMEQAGSDNQWPLPNSRAA